MSTELIELIATIIIPLAVWWGIYLLIMEIPPSPKAQKVIRIVFIVVAIIYLLRFLPL
ncbi:MAG: hypothetical protein Q8P56_01030 [Candidatus Uhrbacteria bacterium]|nr:hypothetical protein [Candidatus Uhrbacteria bacterium]